MTNGKAKKIKKFNPQLLNAILRCFDLLDLVDQEWLVNRLADQWWKNKKKIKRGRK